MGTRKTQQEQIKSATRAYILPLSRGSRSSEAPTDRFQVYLLIEGVLQVLWPSDSHLPKSKEILPCQVVSKNKNLPFFHFALRGYGFSKEGEIAETLLSINPGLIIETLGGSMPSHVNGPIHVNLKPIERAKSNLEMCAKAFLDQNTISNRKALRDALEAFGQ